jgi:hypothetical protein
MVRRSTRRAATQEGCSGDGQADADEDHRGAVQVLHQRGAVGVRGLTVRSDGDELVHRQQHQAGGGAQDSGPRHARCLHRSQQQQGSHCSHEGQVLQDERRLGDPEAKAVERVAEAVSGTCSGQTSRRPAWNAPRMPAARHHIPARRTVPVVEAGTSVVVDIVTFR